MSQTHEITGRDDPAHPIAAMRALSQSWDVQQAAYIAEREQRFDVMLDVLDATFGDGDMTVLDLACGTGSISRRVAERFPEARIIAVDLDPVLLGVAAHDLAPYGDRCTVIDADLASPGWPESLASTTPDVALSTTALHWLPPSDLVALYRQLADVLPAGGLFLNGDHLHFDAASPTMARLAVAHNEAAQARAHAAGALTWDEWWEQAMAIDELAGLRTLREQRFEHRLPPDSTTVAFHLAALRQAGFAEASTVWQLFDDYVVLARR